MKQGRGWEGAALESDARCSIRHGCPRVGSTSKPFFFFSPTELHRLGLIRADSALIRTEPGRFGQNQVISAESSRISRRPKRTEMVETGRNQP